MVPRVTVRSMYVPSPVPPVVEKSLTVAGRVPVYVTLTQPVAVVPGTIPLRLNSFRVSLVSLSDKVTVPAPTLDPELEVAPVKAAHAAGSNRKATDSTTASSGAPYRRSAARGATATRAAPRATTAGADLMAVLIDRSPPYLRRLARELPLTVRLESDSR